MIAGAAGGRYGVPTSATRRKDIKKDDDISGMGIVYTK